MSDLLSIWDPMLERLPTSAGYYYGRTLFSTHIIDSYNRINALITFQRQYFTNVQHVLAKSSGARFAMERKYLILKKLRD